MAHAAGLAVSALCADSYFDSLHTVLSELEDYLSVCPAMRIEVMAMLFTTRRFHVVYSSYVTAGSSPRRYYSSTSTGP